MQPNGVVGGGVFQAVVLLPFRPDAVPLRLAPDTGEGEGTAGPEQGDSRLMGREHGLGDLAGGVPCEAVQVPGVVGCGVPHGDGMVADDGEPELVELVFGNASRLLHGWPLIQGNGHGTWREARRRRHADTQNPRIKAGVAYGAADGCTGLSPLFP